jgi:hypothetical protein
MQEIRQEKNDFKLIRILKRKKNIEIHLSVNQSNQEMKNSNDVVISLKKKKRKRKKSKMSKLIRNKSTDSKIYMIESASFYLLIKQKKTEIFALFSREIDT